MSFLFCCKNHFVSYKNNPNIYVAFCLYVFLGAFMGNGISVEWLLALEKALASKNWDSESAVINYVNRISDTKLTNVSDINEAIVIISKLSLITSSIFL